MIEVDGREPIEIPGWSRFACRRHRPYVYRCYASDGTLLYIGRTEQLPDRFYRHAGKTPWWSQVARYTLQECVSRDASAIEEQRAIRDENPAMNKRLPGRESMLIRWCGGGDKP